MTIFKGDAAKGSANIAYPAFAGAVSVNRFTMPIPTTAKAGDILEIGILPANATIVDAILDSDVVAFTLNGGLFKGTGNTPDSGDEIFTAVDCSKGGVVRTGNIGAFRIEPASAERSIGLKITTGTAAAGGLIGLTVFITA